MLLDNSLGDIGAIMSIYHYAVNYDKKEYYELWKGNWHNLSSHRSPSGKIDVQHTIVFGCRRKIKRLCRLAFRRSIASWYLDKMARKLARLSPFRIIDDSWHEYLDDDIFKCIGSR